MHFVCGAKCATPSDSNNVMDMLLDLEIVQLIMFGTACYITEQIVCSISTFAWVNFTD